MSSIRPSPQTWTLRFKCNMTTILIHADPLQKLSSVKSELLKAIKQTHPDGKLNRIAIPTKAEDILLAKPVDINDLSAGWMSIASPKDTGTDGEDSGKGKGKAAVNNSVVAKKSSAGKNVQKDSLQGVGLRDGGIVAFKFRTAEQRADADRHSVDDDDDEMIVAEDEDANGEVWDVIVPSMEETYDEALPGEDDG